MLPASPLLLFGDEKISPVAVPCLWALLARLASLSALVLAYLSFLLSLGLGFLIVQKSARGAGNALWQVYMNNAHQRLC